MLRTITIGSIVSGIYMGISFTGIVTDYTADQSGYRGTHCDRRMYIKLDSDMVMNGWTRAKAGQGIIARFEAKFDRGGCSIGHVCNDSKYELLVVDGVTVHEGE